MSHQLLRRLTKDPVTLTTLVSGAIASATELKALVRQKFSGNSVALVALTEYEKKPYVWEAFP